jgi:hypothetical protein
MEIAESQLARLSDIARTTLSVYREQAEAKDFDFGGNCRIRTDDPFQASATSKIEIRKDLKGPVTARVFCGRNITSGFKPDN